MAQLNLILASLARDKYCRFVFVFSESAIAPFPCRIPALRSILSIHLSQEPLDPIPPGHIALAVEAIALDIVDWDIEEIGEKAGFDIQYKYTGVNDPKD